MYDKLPFFYKKIAMVSSHGVLYYRPSHSAAVWIMWGLTFSYNNAYGSWHSSSNRALTTTGLQADEISDVSNTVQKKWRQIAAFKCFPSNESLRTDLYLSVDIGVHGLRQGYSSHLSSSTCSALIQNILSVLSNTNSYLSIVQPTCRINVALSDANPITSRQWKLKGTFLPITFLRTRQIGIVGSQQNHVKFHVIYVKFDEHEKREVMIIDGKEKAVNPISHGL